MSILPEIPKRTYLRIKRLPHAQDLPLPKPASEHSSGLDIRAAIDEPITLKPGEIRGIPTGICVELYAGYELQVRPRSGLALKHGITVLNTPGTIDADYIGEIHVILINHGPTEFQIVRGDRIAQIVMNSVILPVVEEVEQLQPTERGEHGFGSTGVQG